MYKEFTDTSNGVIFLLTLAFFCVSLYNLGNVTEKRSKIDYSNSSVSLLTNVQLPALFHRNTSWVPKSGLVACPLVYPGSPPTVVNVTFAGQCMSTMNTAWRGLSVINSLLCFGKNANHTGELKREAPFFFQCLNY